MTESQTNQCQNCKAVFTIEPEDFVFYEKMQFAPPTWCPMCRLQRRQVWRNERKLYRRTSDLSGKDIVSVYAPNSPYTVYSLDEWWGDSWDGLEYGRDFDFSRPFFEQFDELLRAVPRLSIFNAKTENSEYVNYTTESKDCYLSSVVYYGCESIYHSYYVFNQSRDCVDVNDCYSVEDCYQLTSARDCFGCKWSNRLTNCQNVLFSQDMVGCSDCLLCTNLTRKQYCIRNEQLSKEEYERQVAAMNLGSRASVQALLAEYEQLRTHAIVKYTNITNSEDSTGSDLHSCKNVQKSFGLSECEDCRYCFYCGGITKNVYDASGGTYEWAIEANHTGFGSNFIGTSSVLYSSFVSYSESCYNSTNLFGCVGLRSKKFCIFNKQYTQTEYEALATKIIAHMKQTGEWGQFFPMSLSPFGYNETIANECFPLERAEVLALGATWQDEDFSPHPTDGFYTPLDDIQAYKESEEARSALLAGMIQCQVTGRPFKVAPQELSFYLKHSIPIPTQHPDVRHRERFLLRGPLTMQERQCQCAQSDHDHQGQCPNQFETTYPPESPNKVYCEQCYQKTVE